MEQYTYRVLVDWDRDGDTSDSGEDLTPFLQAINWTLGFKESYKSAAGRTGCEITLNNKDKRFSPEQTSGPYASIIWSLRPVTVQVGMGGSYTTLWTGWTDRIAPMIDSTGDRRAVLTCFGLDRWLQRGRFDTRILTSVTADEIITELLSYVSIPPAVSNGPWLLGITGYSELGVSTYLQASAVTSSLETGKTTFEYVGDDWTEDTPVYDAIASVAEAERGKVFVDRSGQLVFWNRNHLLENDTIDETINSGIQNARYEYIPEQTTQNIVSVTAHPRKLGSSANDTLFELDEPITIDPSSTREIRARLGEQSSDVRVAAIDVSTPNTGDGTLSFSSGTANLITFDVKNVQVVIELQNTSVSTPAVCDTLTITGRKLTQYNTLTIIRRDAQSVYEVGDRTLTLDIDLLQSDVLAAGIANYELFRRKDARGEISQVTFLVKDSETLNRLLNREIGDRICIVEDQTGHTGEYFIIGERHQNTVIGDAAHRFTYFLEPADTTNYWLLGVTGRSELGVSTHLAPL